jgi:hypothetical protein
MSRTRSRSGGSVPPGTRKTYNSFGQLVGTLQGFTGFSSSEVCVDDVGPKPYADRPLNLTYRKYFPAKFDGSQLIAPNTHVYDSYTPSNMGAVSNVPAAPSFAPGDWVTKAIANANPNKPVVDLPLFLFELREFPRMLQELGNLARFKGAKHEFGGGYYLSWQFGWAPLFADLRKLISFGESIDRRKQYLRELSKGRTVRRRLSTWSDSIGTVTLGGQGGCTVQADSYYTGRVWYSMHVKLLTELSPDALEWAAIKATLGLDLSPATIWNMIPWTWFVDYFTGVGDFMEATRGSLKWQYTDLCIMGTVSQKTRNTRYTTTSGVKLTRGGGYLATRKTRQVYGSPRASPLTLPFITGRQMGILGSLVLSSEIRRR